MKNRFTGVVAQFSHQTNRFRSIKKQPALLVKSSKLLVGLLVVMMAWGQTAFSQTNGDYQTRTTVTGNWNGTTTWQQYISGAWADVSTSPTSSDGVITIRSGASITVNASVIADQLSVAGTLTINGTAQTLTIADGSGDDVTVTGTVSIVSGAISIDANAKWVHSVTNALPNCTWTSGSTLEVTGTSNPTNFNQSFANVIWNSSATKDLTSASSFNIQAGNTLDIKAGYVTFFGNSGSASKSQTWSGNLSLSGGNFILLNNPAAEGYNIDLTVNNVTISSGTLYFVYAITNTNGNDITLDVNGTLSLSGGMIDLYYAANTGSNSYSTLNLNSNFNWTGGTIKRTNVTASGPYTKIDFTGTGGMQTFTQTLGSTTYTPNGRATSWAESGTSVLNVTLIGTSGTTLSSLASMTGNLTLNCSGTATLGATTTVNGIVYMTQGTLSGTLTYGGSASINYNGTAAQTTGPEWPGSFNKAVTISNTGGVVTLGTATFTGTSATTTINTGATLATGSGTFTAAGPMAINGAFQINQGAWATGNTWTYTNGTLIFNNSSGSFGVNSSDVFWPTTNAPSNINVMGAGGITLNAARTVTGTFQTSAGITNANNLTFNGIAKLNAGGFFTGSPTYGSSSTLIYNTGGTFGRGAEWNAVSGAGYPNNVQISNSTTLNYPNGSNAAKTIAGSLTIDAGSALYMDYGSPGMNNPLTITGNLNNYGSLSLGDAVGGDLKIFGSIIDNGTFNSNNRAIFFHGSNQQEISGSGTFDIAYVRLKKTGGSVKLLSNLVCAGPNGQNAMEIDNSSGSTSVLDLNGFTLTLGQTGVASTYNNGIATPGVIKGSATSTLSILGTAALGTINFDQTTPGTTNALQNLTINRTSSGTVTLGNALVVDGTLTLTEGALSGSLSYGANGILTYNGTSYSSTGNIEFPETSGPKDLNVTVANATGISLHANRTLAGDMSIASGQKFIIPSGIGLTVSDTLTNSAGNSGLVIKSDGSIKENTTGVSATVEREIAKDQNWHFLSSPVTTQDICNGRFAPLVAHFSADSGATFDFYKWSETTAVTGLPWINLKLATTWGANLTDFGGDPPKFAPKTGYLVAYRSDFPGGATKSFAGTLNAGDQTVTLTYGGNGWNLIGNPFPSAVDWDSVTGKTTGLDNGYYYIYNASKSGGAGYEANLTGKISAMQGFFVLAKTSGTGTIGIPKIAQTHDNNWLKNMGTNPLNQIKLKLATSAHFDEATIVFNENGNISKGWYDACKLFSMNAEVPQVYTLKDDDQKICINSMPFFNKPVTVPVGMIIPADGSYTLQLSGLETFPTLPGILLEDLKTNTTQNLVQTPVYAFSAFTTDEPKRFLLHFTGAIGISENSGDHSFQVFSSGNSLYVSDNTGKNQGNVYAYNMMGQLVAYSALNGNSLCKLNMNVPVGYYIVKIVSNDDAFSSKVFIHN